MFASDCLIVESVCSRTPSTVSSRGRAEGRNPGTITPGVSDQSPPRSIDSGLRPSAGPGMTAANCGACRHLLHAPSSMRTTSSMRAVSSKPRPKHSVVPDRRAAASPEPITLGRSDQSPPRSIASGLRPSAGPGMTAGVCRARGHQWRATSSMRGGIYRRTSSMTKNVTYAVGLRASLREIAGHEARRFVIRSPGRSAERCARDEATPAFIRSGPRREPAWCRPCRFPRSDRCAPRPGRGRPARPRRAAARTRRRSGPPSA
jgi:hypothetical protein